MTNEQREYLDAMLEMMNSKGWKFLIKDLKSNQEAIKDALLAQADVEKFFIAKGRFLTINDLLGLEDYLSQTKAALESQGLGAVDASV